jgi:hypothetical protein
MRVKIKTYKEGARMKCEFCKQKIKQMSPIVTLCFSCYVKEDKRLNEVQE